MSTEAVAASGAAPARTASAGDRFDLEAAWRLHPQVAVRPEAFGALLYHYGTRRLSFVKTPRLLSVLQSLFNAASARDACAAAGVPAEQLENYRHALATLAASGMLCERSGS